MNTCTDCIPCLVTQLREFLRLTVTDEAVAQRLCRGALRVLAAADLDAPPSVVVRRPLRRLRRQTGNDDPFLAIKARFNTLALQLLPAFEARVAAAPDPFAAAVRLAIAANVIDFGIGKPVTEKQVLHELENAMDAPVAGDIPAFARAVRRARRILYLGDNAGEIVFDRPLLQRLPPGRVSFAVRGGPVANDALLTDAAASGLTALLPVIANGADIAGTWLPACSPAFRDAFAAADLIIAKGQGNFETVHDAPKRIFALFMVKCPVVARVTGLPLGSKVLLRCGDREKRGRCKRSTCNTQHSTLKEDQPR